jgi:hypothetical protein
MYGDLWPLVNFKKDIKKRTASFGADDIGPVP